MWLYKNKEFTEENIEKYVGFVYLITDLSKNRFYVGQKVFFNKKAKKPLKGKVNKRRNKVQSDWKEYFGSNEELKNEVSLRGKEDFKKEILFLCKKKSEMNYYETKEIMLRDALISKDYYNSWISCRINKNQLGHLFKN